MIIANDLAHLAWVTFDAPPLGTVWVEALSGAFTGWVRDGLKAGRSPDGRALAKDLVSTQARPDRDAEPFGEMRAAELQPDDLDAFANAFLAASGDGFRPKYIAEGAGAARKVRKRRDDEAYDLSLLEGETGSDRLLRILTAWRQDRADFNALVATRVGLNVADLVQSQGAFARLNRVMEEQRRFAALADPFPGLKAATQALQSPAYKALTDAIRPSIALSDRLRHLTQPPASGILAQIEAQQAQMREIARLTMPAADLLKGLRLYPNLATDLAEKIGLAGQAASAAKALAAAMPTYDLVKSVALTSLIDQSAFASAIGRQFDLRLPVGTLAAISALTATSALADQVRLRSFFPPGFQMAAALGLGGAVARGLAADVLHHYNEATPEAPAFAEALTSTAIVDAGVLSEAEAVGFLQRVVGWLLGMIEAEPDIIRRNGLIGVLMFVITVVTAYIGYESLLIGERGLAVAQESLVAAKAGPTRADLEALIQETKAAREAAEDRARGDAKVHDRLRYVHDHTPLRAEPQAKGLVLRLVYPDQTLRVVDAKGEWVEVEVFDYQSDHPIRGWMSRRRLRLQPLP